MFCANRRAWFQPLTYYNLLIPLHQIVAMYSQYSLRVLYKKHTHTKQANHSLIKQFLGSRLPGVLRKKASNAHVRLFYESVFFANICGASLICVHMFCRELLQILHSERTIVPTDFNIIMLI